MFPRITMSLARNLPAGVRAACVIALIVGLLAGCDSTNTPSAGSQATVPPVVLGFYVNWSADSRASLERYAGELTHVAPTWLRMTPDGVGIVDLRTHDDRAVDEPFMRAHNLPILPLINNYVPATTATEAHWSTDAVARLLTDATSRSQFIGALREKLVAERWQGVMIDFEQIAPTDRDKLTTLMRELRAAFAPKGLLVTQVTQVSNPAFDLPQLAAACDFIVPMVYDEHWGGAAETAGSIAGILWTRNQLAQIFADAPSDKIVVGLGNYAYDWVDNALEAEVLTYTEAIARAEAAHTRTSVEGQLVFDPQSLNPTFSYTDENGMRHIVWLLDATTAYNQWTLAGPSRPRGVALWRLGAEDPAIWQVIGRGTIGMSVGNRATAEALARLARETSLTFDSQSSLLVAR